MSLMLVFTAGKKGDSQDKDAVLFNQNRLALTFCWTITAEATQPEY